jgi:hypothetical protein
MKITNKAELFENWAEDSGRCFKTECHEEIAKAFDSNCEVDYYNRSDEIYGQITEVTFSDGSITEFNYKGEIE